LRSPASVERLQGWPAAAQQGGATLHHSVGGLSRWWFAGRQSLTW